MTKRILKGLALAGALVLLALLALLVLARYAFPNEMVRQNLEQMLSARLGGTVRVASLSFNPLAGLEVSDLSLSRNGTRALGLDRLTLRYNLWHLLQGRLLVEELALGRATAVVDLATLPAAGEAPRPAAAEPRPTAMPAIPLTVDLRRVHVDRSDITITRGDALRLEVTGLAIDAALRAGPEDARASGTVDARRVAVALGPHVLSLPVAIGFDLIADLPDQRLSVTALSIRSDPALHLTVSGTVRDLLSAPDLDLALHDARIDLDEVLRLAGPMLPDQLTGARLAGILSPTIAVSGRLGEGGLDGTADVELEGSAIRASMPALEASLEPTKLLLRVGGIQIRSGLPQAGRAEAGLSTAGMRLGAHALRDVAIQLAAALDDAGQATVRLSVDGRASLRPAGSAAPRRSVPLVLSLDASGHRGTEAVSLRRALVEAGTLGAVELSAELAAPEGRQGRRAFTLTGLVEAQTGEVLAFLPPAQRGGVSLVKEGDPDRIRFEAEGALDAAFRPLDVAATGSVLLAGLRTTVTGQGRALAGLLERLRVGIQASYGAETRELRGRLTGGAELAGIQQGGGIAAERVRVKLEAGVTGRLAADLSLQQLLAQPRLSVLARRLRYRGGEMDVSLPEVTLGTAVRADLLGGRYRVDALEVAAGSLVTVSAKGQYDLGTRRFAATLSVPSLALGSLTRHLSGPARRSIGDLHPKGRAALRLHASGTIPTEAEVRALALPVTARATVELHEVSGAWYERAVRGGDAVLRLSISPESGRRIQAEWRVRAGELQLAGSGPLHRVRGAYADGAVTAEELDSVVLTGVRAGMTGAGVTLDGTVDGLQAFLKQSQDPLVTRVAPLFVKLRVTGNASLERFQETLRGAGVEGAGGIDVALDLLKKSDGPLSLRLRLAPRDLTVSKEGIRVVELDGGVTLRKVLHWRPGLNGTAPDGAFSPLAALPELRMATPERDALHIRTVEAAGLRIDTVSAGLSFDRNRLVVQDLAMDLLDGGLGGTILLEGGRAFAVTTRLEAAHLDLNELLPEADRVTGDSLIDGTVNLTAVFDSEQGRLDFGRSTAELAVTRIGRDALDRLLQVLDPQGSNPSIVSARSAVSLANPAEVRVSLFKGMVGLQIEFQEGLLKRFEMDRIPVSKIRQVRNLTQTVPHWQTIREVMALIGAQRYGVDRAGRLALE